MLYNYKKNIVLFFSWLQFLIFLQILESFDLLQLLYLLNSQFHKNILKKKLFHAIYFFFNKKYYLCHYSIFYVYFNQKLIILNVENFWKIGYIVQKKTVKLGINLFILGKVYNFNLIVLFAVHLIDYNNNLFIFII